jgi:hypothetical protein
LLLLETTATQASMTEVSASSKPSGRGSCLAFGSQIVLGVGEVLAMKVSCQASIVPVDGHTIQTILDENLRGCMVCLSSPSVNKVFERLNGRLHDRAPHRKRLTGVLEVLLLLPIGCIHGLTLELFSLFAQLLFKTIKRPACKSTEISQSRNILRLHVD